MPPEMVPSCFRAGTPSMGSRGMRVLSSLGSRSRPRTSVSRMRFSDPKAMASSAAAVSALML